MIEEQYEAISRLKAWIRDFGHEKQPVFIADLNTVLRTVEPRIDSLQVKPGDTVSQQNVCTCPKGRIDYTCPYCKSQGHYGAMENKL